MEPLWWGLLLTALALLSEYLGLTYGHAWLAWAAAGFLWWAFYVWSTPVLSGSRRRKKWVVRLTFAALLAGGTGLLLHLSPHETHDSGSRTEVASVPFDSVRSQPRDTLLGGSSSSPRTKRPRKGHTRGFMQVVQREVEPEHSILAPGRQFCADIQWGNLTQERLFNVVCYTAGYIESVDAETEKRVHRRFLEQTGRQRHQYAKGEIKGPEIAPTKGLHDPRRVFPQTDEQVADLIAGRARIYFVSWIGWDDSYGQPDSAFECCWLVPPDSSHVVSAEWRYCDE